MAYDFRDGHFSERWSVDSGFVPMDNPFRDAGCHLARGSDPVFGALAGQGNHSISTGDVDGDGCMEIVCGAAVIDHDGSLLYSSEGTLPDGTPAKFGHGDAMHLADIDPDSPGLDLFNVFEGAENAPYGWALRDAETGAVRFGEYAEEDLGRCMIGKIDPATRGLQVWVKEVYDCRGNRLPLETPGTNMKIYWAGDLSTQVTDGRDYLHGPKCGAVNDLTHGTMLMPSGTATNNGTKGNPCLVADIFGDFREELLLRLEDDSAIRIYTSTDLTHHKLFTLLHDPQYRCGVAWQNNCYNQPGYPSFYYASDMDFANVLPQLRARPTVYLAADSTVQSYTEAEAPQTGWGQQLWRCLRGANLCRVDTRPGCPFPQERRYHLPDLTIDNCSATTMPTAKRPSAMWRPRRLAPRCSPTSTRPGATAQPAFLSLRWRCASSMRTVSATRASPNTARRWPGLPGRPARSGWTWAPPRRPRSRPPAPNTPNPSTCGTATSTTTPTCSRPAPCVLPAPLPVWCCKAPIPAWMF